MAKKKKLIPALVPVSTRVEPALPTPEEITIDLRIVHGLRLYTVNRDPNGILDAPIGSVARQKGKALWVGRGKKDWLCQQQMAAEVLLGES